MSRRVGRRVIGINNRDLTTLEVDIERTFELLPRVPDRAVVVAESGFSRPPSSTSSRRRASTRCSSARR